ncbi:hypothetical protein E3P77_00988 [Wallemia ichthyophaga]|nr:hypothetical protein E3P77_00988 [Wallemia ichthyophaga]
MTGNQQKSKQSKQPKDSQLASISNGLNRRRPGSTEDTTPDHLKSIPNRKLRNKLIRQHNYQQASQRAFADYQHYLLPDSSNGIQPEHPLERTYKLNQSHIKDAVAVSTAQKSFSLSIQSGVNALSYSNDGRNLAFTAPHGRIASFDPTLGRLHTDINTHEHTSAITYLHNSSMMAVAQSKYVYIYDNQGLELHKLPDHIEPRHLQFLPHHFLLASAGHTGWLKWQDVSTGAMVAQTRTRLGPTTAMAQNRTNAILSLGSSNGTVSFYSPSTPHAHVKLQAHRGGVRSIDHDRQGRYLASAGADGMVKLWDMRMWRELTTFRARNQIADISFSDTDMLAVGWGNHAYVYRDLLQQQVDNGSSSTPTPYLTHHFSGRNVNKVAFCPYEDVLSVGHAGGLDNLLIPGAGEGNYDSLEADPFEGKGARREREVRQLLDKIQPDLITFNDNVLGGLHLQHDNNNPNAKKVQGKKTRPVGTPKPFAQMSRSERLRANGMGESDEEEGDDGDDQADDDADDAEGMLDELDTQHHDDMGRAQLKQKKKMRGRNTSTKKYLARKRKNVVEPSQLALKAKLAKEKADIEANVANRRGTNTPHQPSALDRFTK